MDGIDATSAGYEVGYKSVSQFSREYSRFFRQPPMRDVKAVRDGKAVVISAESRLVPGSSAIRKLRTRSGIARKCIGMVIAPLKDYSLV